MRRFSVRQGIIEPRIVLQREGMDQRLWSRLWSAMGRCFWNHFNQFVDSHDDFTNFVLYKIQDEFLGKPTDEIDDSVRRFIEQLKGQFTPQNWNEFYDLAQFLADLSKISNAGQPFSRVRRHAEVFITSANEVLEAEKSAYRFVGGELVEIIEDVEIEEIEDVLSQNDRYAGAKQHIRTALSLFGNRDNPDYRNSIKEAVSAVESAFNTINGEKSNSLSSAITKSEGKGFDIPPALKEGIKKIYGWRSDEDGVRHALFEDKSRVGDAEARLMIVICSSLVNFLIIRNENLPKDVF